jgi:hypothetical protein
MSHRIQRQPNEVYAAHGMAHLTLPSNFQNPRIASRIRHHIEIILVVEG